MCTVRLSILLGLSLSAVVQAAHVEQHNGGNPVQKVIGLLERMESQIQSEGKEEAAAYDKFACFCKEQADDKLYSITKGNKKIAMLTASIENLEAEIAELQAQTESTKTEIENMETTMEENQAQRDSEFAQYESDWSDLSDAIERLEDGIKDMEGSKGGMAGAKTDLLSKEQKHEKAVVKEIDDAKKAFNKTETNRAVMLAKGFSVHTAGSAKVTSEDLENNWDHAKQWRRRTVKLLMTSKSVKATPKQLQALYQWASEKQPAFEFSSNKHIEILEELLKLYNQNKYEREVEESNMKHQFNMEQQSNQHKHDQLNDLKNRLEMTEAEKSSKKGKDESDKSTEEENVAADQSFLDELTADCEDKATKWDARSKVRSGELTALSEALGILKKGVATKYGANNKMAGLIAEKVQVDKAEDEEDEDDDVSFLQKRRRTQGKLTKQQKKERRLKVIDMLAKKAQSLKDAVLTSVVMKARQDNFGQVKTLIEDLIKKLEDEAKAEEEESQWCQDEMAAATEKRDDNQAEIDKKDSAIIETTALVEKRKAEIKVLDAEITDLYKAINEQTQMRAEDQSENEQTLLDSRAGLSAITAAIEVLENFYNNPTGEALVQIKKGDRDGNELSDVAPESDSFTGENTGKQDEASGIIGLMNVIKGDFEKNIEMTEQAETDGESSFQDFKTDAESDIDLKKSDKEGKEGENDTAGADLVNFKDQLKDARSLKADAIDELAKLKPACLDTGAGFAERKARREQEIEALNEAIRIIDELE